MKRLAFILFIFITLPCLANRIDHLSTDDDVLAFIKKTLNRREVFKDKPFTPGTLNFHFLKMDLNNDGLTDILINGKYLYAIIDKGRKNNFEENPIRLNDCQCELLGIDSSHHVPLLIIAAGCADRSPRTSTSIVPIDTLVNMFGGFIEYNAYPASFNFTSLKASTFPCFGPCPVFDLMIDKDKECDLECKDEQR